MENPQAPLLDIQDALLDEKGDLRPIGYRMVGDQLVWAGTPGGEDDWSEIMGEASDRIKARVAPKPLKPLI